MNTKILPLDLHLIETIGGNYTKYKSWLYEELKLAANVSNLDKVKQTSNQIDIIENSLIELNSIITKFNVQLEDINVTILRSKEVEL